MPPGLFNRLAGIYRKGGDAYDSIRNHYGFVERDWNFNLARHAYHSTAELSQ